MDARPKQRLREVIQLSLYLIVGGAAFICDIITFVLLTGSGLGILTASTAGFLTGAIINYYLSVLLTFRNRRFGRLVEIGRLLAVMVVGLGLTTALMEALTNWCGLSGLEAKFIAVPIVLAWNFLGRRLWVFHPDMPELTADLGARAIAAAAKWNTEQSSAQRTCPDAPRTKNYAKPNEAR